MIHQNNEPWKPLELSDFIDARYYMVQKSYMVIGGEYTDTDFQTLVNDTWREFGPFATYREAVDKWREMSWRYIDFCMYRFHIAEIN